MPKQSLSRRQFAATLGVAVAAAAARTSFSPLGLQRPARPPRPAGMILLNANENPYGPSPKALAAMTQSQSVAMRYPGAAIDEVVHEIAQLHGVTPDNIALGCGSTEILRVCDMAFLAPDKNLVAAEPTFEAVLEYARVTRAQAIKIPLTTDFRHDLPRMAAQCTSRTGVVYLCNPNNPTGSIVTRDEMVRFFDDVPKSTLIIVDEAYHHFVDDLHYSSATEWLDKMPNLIVARTFSKIYGLAGMRLGYAIGNKDTLAAMRPYLNEDNCNAGVLAAANAGIQDSEYVAECRTRIVGSRNWLSNQLKGLGCNVISSQGNFMMVAMGRDVRPVIEEFRKRNVAVGRQFPSMGQWLRVSIGTSDDMNAFFAAFREIYCAGKACPAAA
ncbi:MAG: histidinol-phosphate transaminase [Candidatus Acidiferrales bacterium]